MCARFVTPHSSIPIDAKDVSRERCSMGSRWCLAASRTFRDFGRIRDPQWRGRSSEDGCPSRGFNQGSSGTRTRSNPKRDGGGRPGRGGWAGGGGDEGGGGGTARGRHA